MEGPKRIPNHAGEFTGPVINDMDTMIDALNQALGLDQPLPAKQAKALVATATAISPAIHAGTRDLRGGRILISR